MEVNKNTQPQDFSIANLIQQNLKKGTSEEKPSKKMFRYPYMDKKCISETIQNGKKFAAEFNKAQAEKSKGINQINYELRKATKENKHTTEQKVLFQEYKQAEKLANLEPMAYNQKVILFNREHGTNFLMRKYAPLRNEIAVTFSYLVFFYAAQIRDNNARKMNAGVTTMGTLPRLLTNSESLRRYKVEGTPQCPYKNDAILKHVHTLTSAGILESYKSHGRNIGFSVEINPEILSVSDHNLSKTQNSGNPLVMNYKTGKSTYSDCITRTLLNKDEIKGDATASPNKRNDAIASKAATGNIYKVTKSEGKLAGQPSDNEESLAKNPKENEKQGHKKPSSAKNLLSDDLAAKIKPTWELCQELAGNMHINHVPICSKKLNFEARKGTLSQQAFRELLFQEFLRVISRLKKTNQSAAGAFYRAFEELEHTQLKNFAGRYFLKTTMVEEFEKWLWMVDHAERWGKKRDWDFLYINDYLDTQRRDAKEVGFWYLEKQWKANEKKKSKNKIRRLERVKAAQGRKKQIKKERVEKYGYRSVKPKENASAMTDFQKASRKVREYLYGKIAFEELHRYCRHNLNKTIVDGLQNLIETETQKLRKYNA